MGSQRSGQVGVVTAQELRAVLLDRDRDVLLVVAHRRVLQHHRQDRDLLADSRFDVHPDHPDRRVAHEVDAELLGCGHLGTHDRPQAEAQLGRVTPAQVASGCGRFVDRHQLVAWVARVVGDDCRGRIGDGHEIGDHAVGVQRCVVGTQFCRPAGVPRGGGFCDMGFDLCPFRATVLVAQLALEFLEQSDGGQLRVSQQGDIGDVVFVEITWIVGVVNDSLAGGNVRGEDTAGEAAAQGEYRVAAIQVIQ